MRWQASQSSTDRGGIENGIWLCTEHHRQVDRDEVTYTIDLLREWKRQHEEWLLGNAYVPSLPTVTVTTLGGLHSSLSPRGATDEQVAMFRDHRVVIASSSRHKIWDLYLRFQVPEGLVDWAVAAPIGCEVRIVPVGNDSVMHASGAGASVTVGAQHPWLVFEVQVEKLRLGRPLNLLLRTHPGWIPPLSDVGDTSAIRYYVGGELKYDVHTDYAERAFLVPLSIDADRRWTADPAEELGGQPLIELCSYF
jgi:hypothetical protein